MAKVPTTGNIQMFDAADSIYEVVNTEIGTPAAKEFDDILTYVKTYCSIEQFDAGYRPATINDVNETEHFRGFPATKVIILGYEGDTQNEACNNGGVVFYQGGYTGTLSIGDTLSVTVNGSMGYFKILYATDSNLIGHVVKVDDDNEVVDLISNPCPLAVELLHLCENRIGDPV